MAYVITKERKGNKYYFKGSTTMQGKKHFKLVWTSDEKTGFIFATMNGVNMVLKGFGIKNVLVEPTDYDPNKNYKTI